MSIFESLGPVNVTLHRNKIFSSEMKLRILRWGDYPGLPWWDLNPITRILINGRQREIGHRQKRKRLYSHRDRDRSNAVREYYILTTSEFERWVPFACHMAWQSSKSPSDCKNKHDHQYSSSVMILTPEMPLESIHKGGSMLLQAWGRTSLLPGKQHLWEFVYTGLLVWAPDKRHDPNMA